MSKFYFEQGMNAVQFSARKPNVQWTFDEVNRDSGWVGKEYSLSYTTEEQRSSEENLQFAAN